jgi:hypothetical protein
MTGWSAARDSRPTRRSAEPDIEAIQEKWRKFAMADPASKDTPVLGMDA